MFLPDFSKNAHRDTTPPYLIRGIRPLATRGDQRCCVTTCFSSISRPGLGPAVGPKTPNVRADFSNGADRDAPAPPKHLGAYGPWRPLGMKGAAFLRVFPASAGRVSARPWGRKRPTFGPIFGTMPTGTRPPPPNTLAAYGAWPPDGIKGAALLHVFPASAGLGSSRPSGRKRPTLGPIFQTTLTWVHPRT
jgi:hypothetical protein